MQLAKNFCLSFMNVKCSLILMAALKHFRSTGVGSGGAGGASAPSKVLIW